MGAWGHHWGAECRPGEGLSSVGEAQEVKRKCSGTHYPPPEVVLASHFNGQCPFLNTPHRRALGEWVVRGRFLQPDCLI